jgi:hypothetical protein
VTDLYSRILGHTPSTEWRFIGKESLRKEDLLRKCGVGEI